MSVRCELYPNVVDGREEEGGVHLSISGRQYNTGQPPSATGARSPEQMTLTQRRGSIRRRLRNRLSRPALGLA